MSPTISAGRGRGVRGPVAGAKRGRAEALRGRRGAVLSPGHPGAVA